MEFIRAILLIMSFCFFSVAGFASDCFGSAHHRKTERERNAAFLLAARVHLQRTVGSRHSTSKKVQQKSPLPDIHKTQRKPTLRRQYAFQRSQSSSQNGVRLGVRREQRKKFIPLEIGPRDTFETAGEICGYLNRVLSVKNSLTITKEWGPREKGLFQVILLACKTTQAKQAFLSAIGLNDDFFNLKSFPRDIMQVAINLELPTVKKGEALKKVIQTKMNELLKCLVF